MARPIDTPDAVVERAPPSGRTLVLSATYEGQTHRIAERIAGALRLRGQEPDVRDAPGDAPSSLSGDRAAVLGASVHPSEHEPETIAFVRRHRAELEGLRSARVTVSLAEVAAEAPRRSPDDLAGAMREVHDLVPRFLEETRRHPDTIHRAAGALAHAQPNVFTRVPPASGPRPTPRGATC